jgi:hypothetical protein
MFVTHTMPKASQLDGACDTMEDLADARPTERAGGHNYTHRPTILRTLPFLLLLCTPTLSYDLPTTLQPPITEPETASPFQDYSHDESRYEEKDDWSVVADYDPSTVTRVDGRLFRKDPNDYYYDMEGQDSEFTEAGFDDDSEQQTYYNGAIFTSLPGSKPARLELSAKSDLAYQLQNFTDFPQLIAKIPTGFTIKQEADSPSNISSGFKESFLFLRDAMRTLNDDFIFIPRRVDLTPIMNIRNSMINVTRQLQDSCHRDTNISILFNATTDPYVITYPHKDDTRTPMSICQDQGLPPFDPHSNDFQALHIFMGKH